MKAKLVPQNKELEMDGELWARASSRPTDTSKASGWQKRSVMAWIEKAIKRGIVQEFAVGAQLAVDAETA